MGDPKKTFLPKNEIEALSCKNGKASLADGQEVTIESPNFPENYPNKAKCNWKIKVPANEEMHIWCETFDLLKGDFLRVKGLTPKLYGSFDAGFGEYIPASSEARTLKVQFQQEEERRRLQMPDCCICSNHWVRVWAYHWLWLWRKLPDQRRASGWICVRIPVQLHGRLPHRLHHDRRGPHSLVLDSDENNDHVSGVGAWG